MYHIQTKKQQFRNTLEAAFNEHLLSEIYKRKNILYDTKSIFL